MIYQNRRYYLNSIIKEYYTLDTKEPLEEYLDKELANMPDLDPSIIDYEVRSIWGSHRSILPQGKFSEWLDDDSQVRTTMECDVGRSQISVREAQKNLDKAERVLERVMSDATNYINDDGYLEYVI